MQYVEYLNRFNQHKSFNDLVSHNAKILDFSDQACQEALQKWMLTWASNKFGILQDLFKHKVGPKSDLLIIDQILKDVDFARTYLETFGTSFLQNYCGYRQSLDLVKKYIDGYPTVEYSTQYNELGSKVWLLNNIELDVKELNHILIEEIYIDPVFESLLTLFWSQTPLKKMIISTYLQKKLN